MANMQIGEFVSTAAGADLSAAANLYKIVKGSTPVTGATLASAVLSSAATDKHIGVLQNLPKANETASILARNMNGYGKVLAGGNIAIGDYLTSNASGQAVVTTSAGDEVIGIAQEVGVSGQVITYLGCNSRY